MPNEPEAFGESEKGSGGLPTGPLTRKADEQIVALRKRVALFKNEAQVLFERLERNEISRMEARAEAERLGREVDEAERQVAKWEAQHQRGS